MGLDKAAHGRHTGALPARAGSLSMGVAVAPGETTLTVTPFGATSTVYSCAKAITAALVAAYWPRPGRPCSDPAANEDHATEAALDH